MLAITKAAPAELARTRQPTYDSHVRVFNRQHSGPVTVEAVTAYIATLKKKHYRPATIANAKAALKKSIRLTFKDQAHDLRFIALLDAAFKQIKTPKPDKKVYAEEIVSESETGKLIEALPEKLALIVQALSVTGLRISELLAVTLKDCERVKDNGKPFVSVRVTGKGRKERRVFIEPDLFEAILGTFKGDEFLFVNRSGKPLSRFYVTREITHYGWKVLGKHIHPHSFRHSFATLWVGKKDAKAVSEYLGHASPATTLAMYVHSQLTPSEIFA